MEKQVIPLYNTYSSYGGQGLRGQTWSTMPVPDGAGVSLEPEYFVLPGEFEFRESKYGSFIVYRETNEVMQLGVTFDGIPMLKTPDGRIVKLARA